MGQSMQNIMYQAVRDIVSCAEESGEDPVTTVQEYFREKDSHLTREEVKRLMKAADDDHQKGESNGNC